MLDGWLLLGKSFMPLVGLADSDLDSVRETMLAQIAEVLAPVFTPDEHTVVARIGVLSDTHGYLDPAVLHRFAGVDHVIHAGDVMDPEILARLSSVAPLTAVAGNRDAGGLSALLPQEATGQVAGVRFVVAHKHARLRERLGAGHITSGRPPAPPDLVVYGHDHRPSATYMNGVLHLNPGSASGPDEDDPDPTFAIVTISGDRGLAVEFVPLPRRQPDRNPANHEGRQRTPRGDTDGNEHAP